MNKKIFFLSVLAATSAQADVEVAAGLKLYGTIDQAYTSQSTVRGKTGAPIYKNSGFFAAASTSKFGVKGERDLGDGIKGLIQFEQELEPDESTLMPAKNRTAFVGLAHEDRGGVRLGTQETPAYVLFSSDANGRAEYKPQLWRYLAADKVHDRANNAIRLISPKFGPVSVEVMRGFSEATTSAGSEFRSVGVNVQHGQLAAKLVWDSLTNKALEYALPGDPYAGVMTYDKYKDSGAKKTTMIDKSSKGKALQRAFASVTYDMGVAKLNYIFGGAYTEGMGQVVTNTIGIRVPLDKFTLALSSGTGQYTNSSANNGIATVEGQLQDTTIGAYYNFDKSTTAYLLTSVSKNTPWASNGGSFTADVTGESKTTAVGLRYNY
jgi:predicted porin